MQNYYLIRLFELLDIDECAQNQHDCDKNATCTNAEGSFSCDCIDGYTGNGTSCKGKRVSCRLPCSSLVDVFGKKKVPPRKTISERKEAFYAHSFFPTYTVLIIYTFYFNRYKRMFTECEPVS